MVIFLESSKTDQYRDGAWLPISRTNNSTCPIANLEKYTELAEITFEEPSHLVRGITFKKGRNILKSSCLKYSRVRELVKEAFAEFIDPNIIGVHIAGGASATANAGIPDRLFKRHGRWMSDKAKDGHIKDNLEERLKSPDHLEFKPSPAGFGKGGGGVIGPGFFPKRCELLQDNWVFFIL